MTTSFRKLAPWLLAGLGIAVLLFSGLVLISPTLVNLQAIKSEIEAATSRVAGGTVTTGHIALSFLPSPRIVLAEPRISIPGSVEGGMRSLDIEVRLLPLLSRRLQFSSIELHDPRFTFTIRSDGRPPKGRKAQPQAAGKDIGTLLAAFTSKTAGLKTRVRNGRIEVRQLDGRVIIIRDLSMTVLVPVDQSGPESAEASDAAPQFTIAGSIDRAVLETALLPGPVTVRLDQFTAARDSFSFQNASIRMLDGSVSANGLIPQYLTKARSLELDASGSIGARVAEWIRERSGLPLQPVLRTPIEARSARIRIRPDNEASVSADLRVSEGPSLAFSIDMKQKQVVVRKCRIRDAESQAEIGLRVADQEIEASFEGMLSRSTLERLFLGEQSDQRRLRGAFRLRAARYAPFLRTFDGTLDAENIVIPVKEGLPLEIRTATLQGEGPVVHVASASVVWAAVPLTVKGSVTMHPEYANLDLDAAAGSLDIDSLRKAIANPSTEPAGVTEDAQQPAGHRSFVQGEVRIAAESVSLGCFLFKPVRSSVVIAPGSIKLNRTEATICGIGLSGDLEFRKRKFSVDLHAEAEDAPVEETLACFRTSDHQMTGMFNLTASLSTGMTDDFLHTVHGPVEVKARSGQINRMVSMAKILELVNSTEVFRGKYPGLGTEGLQYNSISLKGEIGRGVLMIREGTMDGTTMEIAGKGTADLGAGRLDFRVAVAPLKTIDAVVKRLPLLKDILRGTLIAVPFRVTGTMSKPEVKSITFAEAGEDVRNIFSRTLKAPFKVVEGLVPGESRSKKP